MLAVCSASPDKPVRTEHEAFAMRHPSPQDGFTLVEVLAAGAVLSAVTLCAVRAWAVVDGLSFDLQLRQKAVFALNGEAERLAAARGLAQAGVASAGP